MATQQTIQQKSFPRTAEEMDLFQRGITQETDAAQVECEKRRDALLHAEKRVQHLQVVGEILDQLQTGWRQADPGKYGPAYFFLNKALERVVVQAFLPAGTKQYSRKEWEKYLHSGDFRVSGYNGIPPHYKIVPLSEIGIGKCPLCAGTHPLIERYHQTEDTPDGDVWQMCTLVVCPQERDYAILDMAGRSSRFR